jgi:hypothetical protein
VEEDPCLDGNVCVGCSAGENNAELRAYYVEGVDLARGAEGELRDGLAEGSAGKCADGAENGHGDGDVRPLDDLDVYLAVGFDVEAAGEEDLTEGVSLEGGEVPGEGRGRHGECLLWSKDMCGENNNGSG